MGIRRFVRTCTFICLLLISSVTLTGCATLAAILPVIQSVGALVSTVGALVGGKTGAKLQNFGGKLNQVASLPQAWNNAVQKFDDVKTKVSNVGNAISDFGKQISSDGKQSGGADSDPYSLTSGGQSPKLGQSNTPPSDNPYSLGGQGVKLGDSTTGSSKAGDYSLGGQGVKLGGQTGQQADDPWKGIGDWFKSLGQDSTSSADKPAAATDQAGCSSCGKPLPSGVKTFICDTCANADQTSNSATGENTTAGTGALSPAARDAQARKNFEEEVRRQQELEKQRIADDPDYAAKVAAEKAAAEKKAAEEVERIAAEKKAAEEARKTEAEKRDAEIITYKDHQGNVMNMPRGELYMKYLHYGEGLESGKYYIGPDGRPWVTETQKPAPRYRSIQ